MSGLYRTLRLPGVTWTCLICDEDVGLQCRQIPVHGNGTMPILFVAHIEETTHEPALPWVHDDHHAGESA